MKKKSVFLFLIPQSCYLFKEVIFEQIKYCLLQLKVTDFIIISKIKSINQISIKSINQNKSINTFLSIPPSHNSPVTGSLFKPLNTFFTIKWPLRSELSESMPNNETAASLVLSRCKWVAFKQTKVVVLELSPIWIPLTLWKDQTKEMKRGLSGQHSCEWQPCHRDPFAPWAFRLHENLPHWSQLQNVQGYKRGMFSPRAAWVQSAFLCGWPTAYKF